MRKRGKYEIKKEVWVCPHCGFKHRAIELLRLDAETLKCKQCGQGEHSSG